MSDHADDVMRDAELIVFHELSRESLRGRRRLVRLRKEIAEKILEMKRLRPSWEPPPEWLEAIETPLAELPVDMDLDEVIVPEDEE